MTESTNPAPGALTTIDSGRTSQVIRTSEQYRQSLLRWTGEHYHVLSPFANFAALPGHYGIVPTMVALDDDPGPNGSGDVYQDNVFTKGADVAIAKIGLAKIAQAAGMSITTERTDLRNIPNLWEVRATVKFVGLDGTTQVLTATEEHDLRDGSPRVKGFTANQLNQQRAKGLRQCEARAINAAIRMFGIRQKYSREDLKKPFVVVRIVFQPDMSDPVMRQQVTERALAGTSALYGTSAPALPPAEPLDVIGVDPAVAVTDTGKPAAAPAPPAGQAIVDVKHDMEAGVYDVTLEGGELLQTASHDIAKGLLEAKKGKLVVALTFGPDSMIAGFTVVTAPPASTAPPSADALFVDKVELRHGKNDRGPWTIATVTFSNGKIATTFSSSLHQLVTEAKEKRLPVRISTSEKAGYDDQLDTLSIIDTRQGTLPIDGNGKY